MGRRHHSVGHLEGLALQLASPILSDDESSVHQGKIRALSILILSKTHELRDMIFFQGGRKQSIIWRVQEVKII